MSARTAPRFDSRFTIEEYLAFADSRPDEERWELIEGVPVLNAAPAAIHQMIVANITSALMAHKRKSNAGWFPMPGTGVVVPASPLSLPQPDLMVIASPPTAAVKVEDAIVIFEILSDSNSKRDQNWRLKVYASIPACRHYVTVSQRKALVTSYSADDDWRPVATTDPASEVKLPALGVALSLDDIYRYTPLGPAA